MAEVGSEENSKQQPTLEQFREDKERQAVRFVVKYGPKESWGYGYDHWGEIRDSIDQILTHRISKSEFKNYKNPYLQTGPYQWIHDIDEQFANLEDKKDITNPDNYKHVNNYIIHFEQLVRALKYLDLKRIFYPGEDKYFEDVKGLTEKFDGIASIFDSISAAHELDSKLDTIKTEEVPQRALSCYAAVLMDRLDLIYKNPEPNSDEIVKLESAIAGEVNTILQTWIDNGLDFLNVSQSVPFEFEANLMSLKHSRFVASTLSIPTGVIGEDLDKMIDEDVFTDDNDIRERDKFLLLCNVRYLLERTHDTYIDEEYDEKYGKKETK